jgi:autotransporter-associated beta strand protein
LLLTSSAGTVILANPVGNTFTGPTTINGGSLVLGSPNAVENSPVTVNVNGGLAFASSGTYNLAELNGSGSISLSGSNGPATLNVGSNNANMTYSGAISGGGGLHLIGAGNMLLSGANTFTGATTINSGVLQLGNSGAVQNSTVALNVNGGLAFSAGIGTFNLGGLSSTNTLNLADVSSSPVTLNVGSDNQSTTFSGTLSGGGSLVKAGSGMLTLSSSNIAYTGNTTVSGGTLQLIDSWNFSNGNNPANTVNIASGAMLQIYTDGTNFPGDNSNQIIGTENTTALTGGGTFQKTGSGVLAISSNNNGFINIAMSAGGLIDLEGGMFRNGGYSAATWTNNQASMYIAAGASLDLWDGHTVYIDALNGPGSVTKEQGNGNVTLTVGVAGGSGTFSGTIQNPQTSIYPTNGNAGSLAGSTVSLVKTGTGTQVLTGSNTYNGTTTINGGVLQVSGGGSIVNSPISVNGGAALQVSGGGSVSSSPVTISAGTMQIGTGAAGNDGTVTSATINNNGSLVYNLYGNQTYSGLILGSGSFLKGGPGTLTLAGGNSYSGPTVIQGGVLQLSSANTSPLASMPGLSSLVDYYPFAGNANDIAGNIPGSASSGAANGTVTGNVVISAAGGRFGVGGVYMPGDGSSNINMGALPAFGANFSSPVTISGWIEMTRNPTGNFNSNELGFVNPNANGGVNSTKSTQFYFDNNGSGPVFTEYYDDTGTLASNANSLNIWQYVTATWDGNASDPAQIYLNGNLNTTLSSSANNGGTVINNLFGLGVRNENWQGNESNIAVFNTNLTAPQIAQLYSWQPLGAAQLPTNSVVELGGPIASTLDLDGVSQQIGGLENNGAYTNGVVINSASSTPVVLTIAATGAETFGGMIEGGGTLGAISLVLSGTGELVLSGTNTYMGGTTVDSGTLVLASPAALADGSSLAVGQGASSLFAPAIAGVAVAAPLAGSSAVTAVPEPGTLALLLAGALWTVAACRRFSSRSKNVEIRT